MRFIVIFAAGYFLNKIIFTDAFSTINPTIKSQAPAWNNVLILDHLNINHEKGRHDLLKAFYFDLLQCAVDPRKEENLITGKKTLWANIGSQQFHLPEGKPDAQVFDGLITLAYPSLKAVRNRLDSNKELQNTLKGTMFKVEDSKDEKDMFITDPWGTNFRLVEDSDGNYVDDRGSQAGGSSEGVAMPDLTFHAPVGTNFAGIARFYEQVLGTPPSLFCDNNSCVINVGPRQTLTFLAHSRSDGKSVCHEELVHSDEGISNYGAHISMYVANLKEAYKRADAIGVTYVNPRFKRRAYTLEEALDQCMFRCIDIVDPQNINAGPILKVEHEVRSVVKEDGSKYKSCPFDKIPEGCVA